MQITEWMVQFWATNANYCFNRKVHYFQIVIMVSRTSHIGYKLVSIKYWKVENVFLKHMTCFWSLKIREKWTRMLGGILKMLQFAFSDPQASIGPSNEWFAKQAVAHSIFNYQWKFCWIWGKLLKVIECQIDSLGTLNHTEIFMVMLIKVGIVYIVMYPNTKVEWGNYFRHVHLSVPLSCILC